MNQNLIPLSQLKLGKTAVVHSITTPSADISLSFPEFEKRLLEMGFIEGTPVTLLHQGPFGRDPLAFRLRTCYTVALRSHEARFIMVTCDDTAKTDEGVCL